MLDKSYKEYDLKIGGQAENQKMYDGIKIDQGKGGNSSNLSGGFNTKVTRMSNQPLEKNIFGNKVSYLNSPSRKSSIMGNGISNKSVNPKNFTSRYVNDSGKWTQNAVNEGYVDFDDYIKDIQNDTEEYISYNNKPLKINYEKINRNDVEDDAEGYAYVTRKYGIMDSVSNTVKDVSSGVRNLTKQGVEYVDEKQKETQRQIWKTGAQKYLREERGFLTAAWMLEHALQDNPSDIERDNNSRIAYLMNNDKEYLSKLDEAISKSKDGTIDTDLPDFRFKTGDLYYSINKAKVHVNGYKQKNGKWLIKTEVNDTYDFSEIQSFMGGKEDEFTTDIGLGTVANDVAVVSQMLGAINPYKVKVTFYTTR